MNCDKCSEEATVFFTEIVNDSVKKLSLCETCAAEYQTENPNLPPFDKLFGKILDHEFLDETLSPEELMAELAPELSDDSENHNSASQNTQSEVCPDCDFSLENYKNIGRFGCPSCYSHFQKTLSPKLPQMHEGTKHQGRVNEHMLERIDHAQILEDLTINLEKAIKIEDYKLAGKIRDEIKKASQIAANDTPSKPS